MSNSQPSNELHKRLNEVRAKQEELRDIEYQQRHHLLDMVRSEIGIRERILNLQEMLDRRRFISKEDREKA